MDALIFVLIWPLLVFVLGVAFISLGDLSLGGWWLLILVIGYFILMPFRAAVRKETSSTGNIGQLEVLRQMIITFALALLAPVFIKYLIEALHTSLAAIIGGLIFGFALVVWGVFTRNNKALSWGNIGGGALVIIYVYSQIWQLGELARVYATGFGLAVAVVVSIIKLKSRLITTS